MSLESKEFDKVLSKEVHWTLNPESVDKATLKPYPVLSNHVAESLKNLRKSQVLENFLAIPAKGRVIAVFIRNSQLTPVDTLMTLLSNR